MRLWNRGLIDEQTLNQVMRNNGVIDPFEAQSFKQLAEEIPTISDVIHFMVRNVGDEDLAKAFGLDNEFEAKFTKQLADWAHGNGLRDDAIKMFWRAHWVVPSPGQLYQSMQRFRPEAVNTPMQFRMPDGTVNPAWKPGMITSDMVTTPQDVDRALGENDVAPFWRNKLVALSFQPLTRRDASIAYREGVIKYAELAPVFRAVGYAEDKAAALAEMLHRQAVLQLKSHPDVKQLETGYASPDQLRQKWLSAGFEQRLVNDVINDAINAVQSGVTAKCVKAVEKRVLDYELSPDQGAAALVQKHIDPGLADTLSQAWTCELEARGRKVAVAELQKLVGQGIITLPDYTQRLMKLGYSNADAQLLASSAGITIEEKVLASARKEQKAAEAAARRSQRDAEQLRKSQERAATARAAKAAKAQQAEAKLTAAWLRLAAQIAKKLGISQDVFSPQFTSAYFDMKNRLGWDDVVINGVMVSIKNSIDKKAPDTWSNYLAQAISAQQTQVPM
jgi:hypothetical protein